MIDLLFTFLLTIIWPLVGLLFGWWGSFIFLRESMIVYGAAVGLIAGLLYGIKKWQSTRTHLYSIGWLPLVGVLLFYAAGMFGFFMGVPLFHVLLAIPVGLYCGRRMVHPRKVMWVMGGVALLVAAASGVIAWTDPYTLANLRGMLQLQLTPLFLQIVIIVGGIALVAVTMVLTKLFFILGRKNRKRNDAKKD